MQKLIIGFLLAVLPRSGEAALHNEGDTFSARSYVPQNRSRDATAFSARPHTEVSEDHGKNVQRKAHQDEYIKLLVYKMCLESQGLQIVMPDVKEKLARFSAEFLNEKEACQAEATRKFRVLEAEVELREKPRKDALRKMQEEAAQKEKEQPALRRAEEALRNVEEELLKTAAGTFRKTAAAVFHKAEEEGCSLAETFRRAEEALRKIEDEFRKAAAESLHKAIAELHLNTAGARRSEEGEAFRRAAEEKLRQIEAGLRRAKADALPNLGQEARRRAEEAALKQKLRHSQQAFNARKAHGKAGAAAATATPHKAADSGFDFKKFLGNSFHDTDINYVARVVENVSAEGNSTAVAEILSAVPGMPLEQVYVVIPADKLTQKGVTLKPNDYVGFPGSTRNRVFTMSLSRSGIMIPQITPENSSLVLAFEKLN